MRIRVLAPCSRGWIGVRVLGICATAGVMAGAASCGTTSGSSSVTATGTTLKIYASVPAGSPDGTDIIDAERLALQQSGTTAGKYKLAFVPLTGTKVSDNARTAIEDAGAIAYLGEVTPGASADSLGITNAEDLLQASPADTALELTQSTPAVPGAPKDYYEALSTYGHTFARVVPSSALEAKVQVQEMQSLGVKKLYVTSDGSPYGAAIARAVRTDGSSVLAAVQGPPTESAFRASGADALFYGASQQDAAAAVKLMTSIGQSDSRVKLFAPSTLDDPTLFAGAGAKQLNLYVSAPGFLSRDLSALGQTFVTDFKSAYGHAPAEPGPAIFAYETMQALLAVLREAGSNANNRATVVHDFLSIKNRQSVLGTYSINSDGDTSLGPFVFSRLRAGTLVPFRFVQVQG